ncbi:poly-gamma-glutamate synthesis protein (capsule biosynthesis protein) [Geosporobacter subterraneus DSM 17957]|uniref:Poly-gamma-glutamate synthesis protein (Capsule biosynthesis protein) n=2 Tax=Geosporobacter TaxID=390805 RepID=A0A1M6GXE3_9FIRM|nr:poly-gamma-glutamate synthesis protein (capsule biosynthesis protein) [Geosporobacter subterraneus DSM 17957]
MIFMKKIVIFLMIVLGLTNFNAGVHAYNEKKESVVISLAGDVMLDRSIGKQIEKMGVDYPWTGVKPYFDKSDLVLINLETSVGLKGSASPDKTYTFQSKPETLDGLVKAGVSGVSIANNHVLDFGQEGFIETLENLEKRKIKYAGGGRNIQKALEPAVWEIHGQKIGFLAFSRVIYDMSWYATSKRPGIVSAYDHYIDQIKDTIVEAKKNVDFLIVSVHWGKELEQIPQEYQERIGRVMIDSGADVVMGHHPHVLQGIEFYKNKPILYSLGNFVFNSKGQLSNRSMIFNIEIDKNGMISSWIVPISIMNGQPRAADEKEGKLIIDNLNALSKKWGVEISTDGRIGGKVEYISKEETTEETPAEENPPDKDKKNKRTKGRIVDPGKTGRLLRILGYETKYIEETNKMILTKRDRFFEMDFANTKLITEKKKGFIRWIEVPLVHFPIRVLCYVFQWDYQLHCNSCF